MVKIDHYSCDIMQLLWPDPQPTAHQPASVKELWVKIHYPATARLSL